MPGRQIMSEVYGIAAFRSRQQALQMEERLRAMGIPTEIVSTPRAVAIGCGLSARFPEEDLGRVQAALRTQRPAGLIGLYRVDARGPRPQVRMWAQ